MAHPSGKPQEGSWQGVEGPGGKPPGPSAPPPLGECPAHSEERECQICRNAFDAERHVPKLLACLHTTCLECLKQLHLCAAARQARGTEDHGDAITCPFCRHLTVLPDGRVQKLPVNSKLAKTLPTLGGENPPPPPLPLETLESSPVHPLLEQRGGSLTLLQEAVKRWSLLSVSLVGGISCVIAAYDSLVGFNGKYSLFPGSIFISISCFLVICFIIIYTRNAPQRTGGRKGGGI